MQKINLKYHHLGIPTKNSIKGEEYLPDYKIFHYGYEKSEFGIEWMRYEEGCNLPEIVKTIPHVAFEVEDVYEAIKGRKVIIEPNSPSDGVLVAFIEENGAPIELIQENINEYHGIIINMSQKDRSVFKRLKIIGKKKFLFGLLTLFKVRVVENQIDEVIKALQKNMSGHVFIQKTGILLSFL